ncbi:MAG: branched-chain amino acid transporter permease [Clostridiales bacterium]|nr:branched-chain amino acid transporter permease [Candidatus Blautia equi]
MINTTHSLIIILICTVVTALTRFLPFLLFPSGDKTPQSLKYLGGVLPGAIMAMLVVYCYKSTVIFTWPYALPEIIATGVVVLSYLWKRNTLLSIGAGTVLYMFLVQVVFV